MTTEDDNFFSRWSRRKAQLRSGEPPPAEPSPPAQKAAATAVVEAGVNGAENVPAVPPAVEPQAPKPPPPTLDDAAALTPDSDFKRFVARGVPADVRNAAVKKLFADPHFNVMDGLDIYIDDYSKPSPLSAAMMAKMVGAQFLKLVDDPNEVKPPPQPAAPTVKSAVEPTETDAAAASTGQASAQADTTSDPTQTPQDDHADLQLQPNHAPERESPGRGAG